LYDGVAMVKAFCTNVDDISNMSKDEATNEASVYARRLVAGHSLLARKIVFDILVNNILSSARFIYIDVE
jgi:hypothetical protein